MLGRIGEGAFGEVSLATCAIFGKVAVKWLKVGLLTGLFCHTRSPRKYPGSANALGSPHNVIMALSAIMHHIEFSFHLSLLNNQVIAIYSDSANVSRAYCTILSVPVLKVLCMCAAWKGGGPQRVVLARG